MSTLIWAATNTTTTTTTRSPSELAAAAISHHLRSAYWKKWLASNPTLGPQVEAYVKGTGPRPAAGVIGSNQYGLALVLTEDIRRG